MKDFKGKVAVITGAASGIGRGIAERFAEEGMTIILADVEEEALRSTEAEMRAEGANVIAIPTDVSKEEDVQRLAATASETYGDIHLLCNNAGVGYSGHIWEISQEDWDWVMGVNLQGVIYGIRHFVPLMIKGQDEGHIVNVASMAGLTSGPGMAPYYVSKHGVVTLSECLHQELLIAAPNIKVSVLCPGFVDTKIWDSGRNRPSGEADDGRLSESGQQRQDLVRAALKSGLQPREVADIVFEGVSENQFYLLPHPETKESVAERMTDILEDRTPAPFRLDSLKPKV